MSRNHDQQIPYNNNRNRTEESWARDLTLEQPSASDHFQSPTTQQGVNNSVSGQYNYGRPPTAPQDPNYYNQNFNPQGYAMQAQNIITTPEDIKFMKEIRNYVVYNRVLPIATIGYGSLYIYNRYRKLPNKFWHYFAVGTASFIWGTSSLQQVFHTRLANTKLNTPFIQSLRSRLNIKPLNAQEEFDPMSAGFGPAHGSSMSNRSQQWDQNSMNSNRPMKQGFNDQDPYAHREPQPYYDAPYNQPSNVPSNEGDNRGANNSRGDLTYDELRARNRGSYK